MKGTTINNAGTIWSLLVCLFLVSCGSDDSVVPSSTVATSRIYATIEIYADRSDTVHASVQLIENQPPSDDTPGDRYIDLLRGDDLWLTTGVNIGDVSLGDNVFQGLSDLAKTQELFTATARYRTEYMFFFFWSILIPERVHYNGSLTDVEADATYTVSLLRRSAEDAAHSTVAMPGNFEIESPVAGQVLSRSSDPLVVEWLPLEDDVEVDIDVSTSCPDGSTYTYQTTLESDIGFAQLDAGQIDSNRIDGSCSTTLLIVKTRLGQLDSAYAGGFISANQVRTVSFTTTN